MSRANIDPALSQDHLTPPLPSVVQLKVGLDYDPCKQEPSAPSALKQ